MRPLSISAANAQSGRLRPRQVRRANRAARASSEMSLACRARSASLASSAKILMELPIANLLQQSLVPCHVACVPKVGTRISRKRDFAYHVFLVNLPTRQVRHFATNARWEKRVAAQMQQIALTVPEGVIRMLLVRHRACRASLVRLVTNRA